MNKTLFSFLLVVFLSVGSIVYYMFIVKPAQNETFLSFVHMGDIHGHLLPREHIREGEKRYSEGGLARVFTIVKHLRERDEDMVLINTGDTIQGSAEALFTRGEAIVKVLNAFGINYYAPGNWDWVYGKERFSELFMGEKPFASWTPLMANVYDEQSGKRIAPAYKIQTIKGIKVGFIGFSSERGPTLVGETVTQGLRFSDGSEEFKRYVTELRAQVDVLIVLSELGLARNIALATQTEGVDFIFSSDMHEETPKAIQLTNGTVLMAEGQDGTRVGELNILLKDKKLLGHRFIMHEVNRNIPENKTIQKLIEEVRAPFINATEAKAFINPISKRPLQGAITEVVGESSVPLARSNFSNAKIPAVIEGSSHNFLADAFRVQADADIGLIRGFRYGTTVPKGDIHREDIYHYIPIGPFIAKGEVTGEAIKTLLENSADGCLSKEVEQRKGGWLVGVSGLHFHLNYYDKKGSRISKIRVLDKQSGNYLPLEMDKLYTIASYNYDSNPDQINGISASHIQRINNAKGEVLDANEVVEAYLKDHKANPELNRVTLDNRLPQAKYRNPEVQPLP